MINAKGVDISTFTVTKLDILDRVITRAFHRFLLHWQQVLRASVLRNRWLLKQLPLAKDMANGVYNNHYGSDEPLNPSDFVYPDPLQCQMIDVGYETDVEDHASGHAQQQEVKSLTRDEFGGR